MVTYLAILEVQMDQDHHNQEVLEQKQISNETNVNNL